MKVACAVAFLALTAGACAHTSDDAAMAQSRATTVSPIQDDADDATASLGEGWIPGAAAREAWIGERADVTFTVARPGAFDAQLDATAFRQPRRLHVSVDGNQISPPFVIGVEAAAPIVLPIGTLGFGPHLIRFESLDGADADGSGQRVSVAVRRLTMERVGG